MNIEIQSAKLVLSLVDQETGEIITKEATLGDFKDVTKKASKPRTKKPVDDDPVAKITLLDGKWQMNKACVELTEFEPDQKLTIEFEKKGRVITPILMESESKGNRLTKTYTVSCRGSKRDNLAKYGDVFEVYPYDGRPGEFKLKGNAELPEDDIIDVPEEISDPEDFVDELDVDTIDPSNISFDFA